MRNDLGPLLILVETRTVELPSDSTFAIAMKSKQAAEREEQQRIKNLVLKYDLRDGEEQDGDFITAPLKRNPNVYAEETGTERTAGTNFVSKSSNNRSGQRARKLQLSDVDWYASKSSSESENAKPNNGSGSSSKSTSPEANLFPGRPLPAPAKSYAAQQRGRTPTNRSSGQVGRVSRKEMLKEHASRNAELKFDGKN